MLIICSTRSPPPKYPADHSNLKSHLRYTQFIEGQARNRGAQTGIDRLNDRQKTRCFVSTCNSASPWMSFTHESAMLELTSDDTKSCSSAN